MAPTPDFGQTDPGLAVLRMAALIAQGQGGPDDETLDLLFEQVEAGHLVDADPALMWPELVRGLMSPSPSKMIRTLRGCGALVEILPEVAALFGVPQIADGQDEVDLGEHLMKTLDAAAKRGATPPVRFALLAMNVGKSDSPREHLPVHYKHVERGRPRIEEMCARFGAPADCRELALLALCECERVHRVTKMRAGPVALMLERIGAFDAPQRFSELMTVCACDFCAHEGREGQNYPKAALLEIALAACAGVTETGSAEARQSARAEAIALAFRSERWSSEVG
ncbi:MAG: tRNA nucleotidyltransferase [Alphaproteobacteria bacterium]|nr:tRNA nucleotidyltransferase [Alphaproteobacteria bacterium]MBM3654002.1 tRNA nucleotidyltransferase [Alphaproteobacteria bacterium]